MVRRSLGFLGSPELQFGCYVFEHAFLVVRIKGDLGHDVMCHVSDGDLASDVDHKLTVHQSIDIDPSFLYKVLRAVI